MTAMRSSVSLFERLVTWIRARSAAPGRAPGEGHLTEPPMSYAEILAASAFLDFGGVPLDWSSPRRHGRNEDLPVHHPSSEPFVG
jgi:hypothetical protein